MESGKEMINVAYIFEVNYVIVGIIFKDKKWIINERKGFGNW